MITNQPDGLPKQITAMISSKNYGEVSLIIHSTTTILEHSVKNQVKCEVLRDDNTKRSLCPHSLPTT